MDQLGLLAKRDIFGIILPGIIVVLVITFVALGTLNLLGVPIDLASLSSQQFLLSLLLFVVAYLVGNLLRLVASDKADEKSGKKSLKEWEKVFPVQFEKNAGEYDKCHAELAMGNDVLSVPEGFDDWLWRKDQFPYAVWQNRKWQVQGFREVLNFYRENYKTGMWPNNGAFPKSFFNYCKLVIAKSNKELTDEVNSAEGLTRFLAGTVEALRISKWLFIAFLLLHVLFAFVVWLFHLPLAPDMLKWQIQGVYFCLATISIFALLWIQQQIISHFRFVRLKEAETVYNAFYLCAGSNPPSSGLRGNFPSHRQPHRNGHQKIGES
ncbi:MAG: hypothetical protein WA821_01170 [Anaerolineales bacterium]